MALLNNTELEISIAIFGMGVVHRLAEKAQFKSFLSLYIFLVTGQQQSQEPENTNE